MCDIRRNNEPPEAVLQGLAMARLVGILRQLGDLAELAADVFLGLHDQVMDASARGRRLAARAKQLEADLQPLVDQEDFLVYDAAHPNTERLSWHADPKVSHGAVAGGDMPYFIAGYIKKCRGPPGLSILDKYDADGDGACLRRYTNPSFFRINSAKLQQDTIISQAYLRDYKPPKPAHTYASILSFRSETDSTSENASPRFLSILRQLKHRQTNGSVFSASLKPQLQQNIQKHESLPEERASSVDHSEVDISFTSSPDLYIAVDASTTTEKAKGNEQNNAQYQDSVMPDCSDAGSDYGERCGELGRTSSFEAWLSPCFRTPEHDIIEESSHDSSNGIFSQGIISRDPTHCGTMKAKQDSVTEELSSKTGGSKRSKYKGSFELIASRVTSFPRKLFIKQHDPSTDYSGNLVEKQLEPAQDTGTDSFPAWRSEYSIASRNPDDIWKEAFLPVQEDSNPVFVTHDSVPESERCYLHHENTREPTASADSNNPLWQGTQGSMHMVNGSLRKSTGVQTENSCSEDADVVIPPLPPIPPMQWLSVKVHIGPTAHRKSLRKDSHKPSKGKILKTSEFANLTVHSDEPWFEPVCTDPQPEAETLLRQESRRQDFSGNTDHHIQVTDRPTGKLIEGHEKLDCKGTDNSAAHGSTVSTSEASKHSNAVQVDAAHNSPARQSNQGCGGNLQNESVFISAVQELAKTSPPSVPRPKNSLLDVGSHDRNKLRNGPGVIYPSRNLLDERSELPEQMKDKPLSVKPVHGSSSNVMVKSYELESGGGDHSAEG